MKMRLCQISDAALFRDYYLANTIHLAFWEPTRSDDYNTLVAWQNRLISREKNQHSGTAAHMLLLDDSEQEILATCSLSNIYRGPFLAANMGYSAAAKYEGKGHMKALCLHTINFAFEELRLHRIMANYMPNNIRSEGLLQNLGFEREGFAKSYLKINGRWEDHVLTSLINPAHINLS